MQVQAGDERNIRADDVPRAAQQLALAVLQMLCDHGAVQVQIDGVHRPRTPQVVHHHAGDALEGLFLDLRRGARIGPDQRREAAARSARRLHEACYRQVDAGGVGEHGLAPAEARPAVRAPEHLEACLCRRKGIRLVVKTADRDPHGPRLPSPGGLRR